MVNSKDKELQLAPRVDMFIFSTSVPSDDDSFESANLETSQTEIHYFDNWNLTYIILSVERGGQLLTSKNFVNECSSFSDLSEFGSRLNRE